jgi:hypothetical protein
MLVRIDCSELDIQVSSNHPSMRALTTSYLPKLSMEPIHRLLLSFKI